LIGYARVSTQDQKLDLQIDALKKAGCEKIFTDVASGSKNERVGLMQCMEYLRPGDCLVVWKIDRLGRSLTHLVRMIEELGERGVGFTSLNDPGFDTQAATGKLLFSIMAALATFERDLISERTKAGLVAARARGRVGGRPKAMTAEKIKKAEALMDQGLKVGEVAKVIGVGKSTLQAAMSKLRQIDN
jgi:DNA invertase Pin-like site-specific DNA recombinase